MRAAALLTLAALCACQEQRTIVVEQAQASNGGGASQPVAPRPVRKVVSPCTAPAGSGPFEATPHPEHTVEPLLSQSVHDQHISGCAGIRFRIGPQGMARDMTLLTEYPLGYGFGDAFRQALANFRWTPRDDLAWHFIIYTHRDSEPANLQP